MTLRRGRVGLLASGLVFGCAAAAPDGDAASPPPPPVELRSQLDRSTVTLGDPITWTVDIEHDPEVEVTLDEPTGVPAGLRLADLARESAETLPSGRILERRRYMFRAELVGSWVLPPLAGAWTTRSGVSGELKTAEIAVEVESVLPADRSEVTDIRDIKPPRNVGVDRSWQLWVLGTGLALAIAALVLAAVWRRRRTRRNTPDAPPLPPYDLAVRELQRLRRTDFSDLRQLRRGCFAVSSVVRTYVEGRFGLNATDLTTEEILGRLVELTRLEPLHARRLERFLVATDRVKFAAHLPAPEEIERIFDQALGFVKATRPAESAEDDAATTQGGENGAAAAGRPGKAA